MKRDLLIGYFTRPDRIAAHIITASLYWSSIAHAEEPLPAIPAGDDVIVALRKDAPAPFSGQLFDNNTAIRWGLWLKQYKERSQVDQDHTRAVCATELNYRELVATIESNKNATLYSDLMARFQASEKARLQAVYDLANPPWYKTATFQFTVGVLTTVTVVFVANKAF